MIDLWAVKTSPKSLESTDSLFDCAPLVMESVAKARIGALLEVLTLLI